DLAGDADLRADVAVAMEEPPQLVWCICDAYADYIARGRRIGQLYFAILQGVFEITRAVNDGAQLDGVIANAIDDPIRIDDAFADEVGCVEFGTHPPNARHVRRGLDCGDNLAGDLARVSFGIPGDVLDDLLEIVGRLRRPDHSSASHFFIR